MQEGGARMTWARWQPISPLQEEEPPGTSRTPRTTTLRNLSFPTQKYWSCMYHVSNLLHIAANGWCSWPSPAGQAPHGCQELADLRVPHSLKSSLEKLLALQDLKKNKIKLSEMHSGVRARKKKSTYTNLKNEYCFLIKYWDLPFTNPILYTQGSSLHSLLPKYFHSLFKKKKKTKEKPHAWIYQQHFKGHVAQSWKVTEEFRELHNTSYFTTGVSLIMNGTENKNNSLHFFKRVQKCFKNVSYTLGFFFFFLTF